MDPEPSGVIATTTVFARTATAPEGLRISQPKVNEAVPIRSIHTDIRSGSNE